MELTTLLGLLGTALTLVSCVWATYIMGGDILGQTFLYRSFGLSFFAGICGYLWGVQLIRLHFKSRCDKMIEAVEKMVIDPNDVAEYDLKKLVNETQEVEDDENEDDLPEQFRD